MSAAAANATMLVLTLTAVEVLEGFIHSILLSLRSLISDMQPCHVLDLLNTFSVGCEGPACLAYIRSRICGSKPLTSSLTSPSGKVPSATSFTL